MQRLIIFDVEDLKQLLIHYTDGQLIPLDSTVKEVQVSRYLGRVISLMVSSKDWEDSDVVAITGELTPYEFAYEGRKIMSWTDRKEDAGWFEAPEAPKSA